MLKPRADQGEIRQLLMAISMLLQRLFLGQKDCQEKVERNDHFRARQSRNGGMGRIDALGSRLCVKSVNGLYTRWLF